MDDRFIDIETRLAHQEHTIAELNEAVTAQQAQIARLESRLEALATRLRSLLDSLPADAPRNERPPHY